LALANFNCGSNPSLSGFDLVLLLVSGLAPLPVEQAAHKPLVFARASGPARDILALRRR